MPGKGPKQSKLPANRVNNRRARAKRNTSRPLKEIEKGVYALAFDAPPLGGPRKRMTTQAREKRNETRRHNKEQRTAEAEHKRRSEAAKKGWAKLSKAERSERALRGWDTREMRSGRTRKKRDEQRYMDEQRRLENERTYGRGRRPSNPFGKLPRGDAPYHGKSIFE